MRTGKFIESSPSLDCVPGVRGTHEQKDAITFFLGLVQKCHLSLLNGNYYRNWMRTPGLRTTQYSEASMSSPSADLAKDRASSALTPLGTQWLFSKTTSNILNANVALALVLSKVISLVPVELLFSETLALRAPESAPTSALTSIPFSSLAVTMIEFDFSTSKIIYSSFSSFPN